MLLIIQALTVAEFLIKADDALARLRGSDNYPKIFVLGEINGRFFVVFPPELAAVRLLKSMRIEESQKYSSGAGHNVYESTHTWAAIHTLLLSVLNAVQKVQV